MGVGRNLEGCCCGEGGLWTDRLLVLKKTDHAIHARFPELPTKHTPGFVTISADQAGGRKLASAAALFLTYASETWRKCLTVMYTAAIWPSRHQSQSRAKGRFVNLSDTLSSITA